MRFVYKNLTEKYTRILKEEHSEKDSLIRIINDMSLSQEEMYATLLKELIKPETEEDFLLSVENLRDVARASYASDARAYARVFNFRMLAADAEKLGYPELANAVDAALTYIHQDSMSKKYRSTERPERGLILLRRDQFKAAFARSQDEKRARVAQQQHTSTHGVDLSNLEETKKYNYDLNKDAVETVSAVEDFNTFKSLVRKFYKKGVHSTSSQFIDAVEAKFGNTNRYEYPDPNTVGGAFWNAYRATAGGAIWGVSEDEARQNFEDWIKAKKVIDAQQQHTSTHGVDLSNLEEMLDHEPWPKDLFERANDAIFDAIIDWNEKENILPKKVKEYTDSKELFSDLVQGILNKHKKQANERKSLQVFVAEIMGEQLKKNLPKGFSKDDIDTWLGSALGDYAWGSWDIQSAIDGTEWVGDKTMRQAAIDAQRQHTKTHGVDLTDL